VLLDVDVLELVVVLVVSGHALAHTLKPVPQPSVPESLMQTKPVPQSESARQPAPAFLNGPAAHTAPPPPQWI